MKQKDFFKNTYSMPKNYIGMYLLHPSLQLQTKQN
jgi:hypothetical protein